jgi:hypothetical protein
MHDVAETVNCEFNRRHSEPAGATRSSITIPTLTPEFAFDPGVRFPLLRSGSNTLEGNKALDLFFGSMDTDFFVKDENAVFVKVWNWVFNRQRCESLSSIDGGTDGTAPAPIEAKTNS